MKFKLASLGILGISVFSGPVVQPVQAQESAAPSVDSSATAVASPRSPKYRQQLDASFVSIEDDGCITNEVDVTFDERVGPNTNASKGNLQLTIRRTDDCEGKELLLVQEDAKVKRGNFQLADGLSSGNLVVDFQYRINKKKVPISVSIDWTAIEEPIVGQVRSEREGLASRGSKLTRSVVRLAEATGNVIVDGVNLTPEPAQDAAMQITDML